ncbi:MAG TPA: MlaD family protein [Sphingomicrobium sp.]|nr:MlaD family protein [Sphingomicrobium sp.]
METRSNYVMVGAVTVALLLGTLLFIVWLAGLSNKTTKCYDIYFAEGVGGLNKGSNVSFSGVPVGQVSKISLLPNRPEFVWVRIDVNEQTPVLQGTSAQIHGVGFTGVSEIQLTGAERGRPPIEQMGPQGCPVVPASSGGISALLNSAPELIDRIQRLTERLTELLGDKNQNSIADILENIDHTSRVLADRAPQMTDAMAQIQVAAHNAGNAANSVAALSNNTNKLVTEQGRPAVENLNKTILAARQAADNLNAMISDARPGVQNFSKSTLPEANRLVHDLRDLSQSLEQVSNRVNQQGIGSALGPQKLPDYNPGKRK